MLVRSRRPRFAFSGRIDGGIMRPDPSHFAACCFRLYAPVMVRGHFGHWCFFALN